MKNNLFILLAVVLMVLGCTKDPVQPVTPNPDPSNPNTPVDTTSTNPGDTTTTIPITDDKGILKAMPRGTDDAPYGYYVYTPEAYATDTLKYPLLIYLHGSDETGDSQSSSTELEKVLGAGPPKMIDTKHWAPLHPMVVV